MGRRLCVILAVVTAALMLGAGVAEATTAQTASANARHEVVAKKKKSKKKSKSKHKTTSTKAATLPSDACKLLTMDEVHQLAPKVDSAEAGTEAQGPTAQSSCHWKYAGDDVSDLQAALTTLDVRVMKLPAGLSSDEIKLALQAEARDSGKEIPGIGSLAVVESAIPSNVEVKSLIGGLVLDVEYSGGPDAQSHQDTVIGLAKSVAGRL
jgi:hypothetical protein